MMNAPRLKGGVGAIIQPLTQSSKWKCGLIAVSNYHQKILSYTSNGGTKEEHKEIGAGLGSQTALYFGHLTQDALLPSQGAHIGFLFWVSWRICDFNFSFAQNRTPAAPSVQAQITMASLGGIAARFGRSAELLRLFCQPQPASPLTLAPLHDCCALLCCLS
ncbi:MAG: hypothetical protein ABSA70_03185 [Terriglobia bacterium]